LVKLKRIPGVLLCVVSPFGQNAGWNATLVSGISQEVVELGLLLSSRHTFYEVFEQSESTPLEITVTISINPASENELWHPEVANDFVGWKPRFSISAST